MDTAESGAVGGSRRGLRSPETADRLALAHAIVAVGGALDELEVVGDLDERPLVWPVICAASAGSGTRLAAIEANECGASAA
jgi:hypothetical protein